MQIEKFLVELDKLNPDNEILSNIQLQAIEIKCDQAFRLFNDKLTDLGDEDAIRYLTKAIENCPGFVKAYDSLGYLYLKTGETQKAIENLSKAADLGSLNHNSYYLLASLLYKKGEHNEAHKYIEKSSHS